MTALDRQMKELAELLLRHFEMCQKAGLVREINPTERSEKCPTTLLVSDSK
jgi:hypothetical protein